MSLHSNEHQSLYLDLPFCVHDDRTMNARGIREFFFIVPWNRGIFRYSMECSMEFHAHRRESVRNKNGN